MDLTQQRLAVIGCGNLAESMVSGLLNQGMPPIGIMVTARRKERLEELHGRYGVHAEGNNRRAAIAANIVILAAKPQQMAAICSELADIDLSHTLLISVAAGLPIAKFEAWLQQPIAMVRSMPNTPAALKLAATGLFAKPNVSVAQRQLTEQIFTAIGQWVWLSDESQMDLVTAIAGSGPAYFFRAMEAMIDSAVAQGMERATATTLVTQTCLGAGALAAQSVDISVADLRQKVSSKGGTTEAALKSLEEGGINCLFDAAIREAVRRGRELAQS